MPTYEYKCAACGHRFERFQSMSAKPVRTCPKCKKRRVKRLMGGGGGLIFKGSGFYITDYKRPPATPQPPAKKESTSPSGSGPAKKEKSKTDR